MMKISQTNVGMLNIPPVRMRPSKDGLNRCAFEDEFSTYLNPPAVAYSLAKIGLIFSNE